MILKDKRVAQCLVECVHACMCGCSAPSDAPSSTFRAPDGSSDSSRFLQPHGFPGLQRSDGLPPAHSHQADRAVRHRSCAVDVLVVPTDNPLGLLQLCLRCVKLASGHCCLLLLLLCLS